MFRIISALVFALFSFAAVAESPPPLADNAPDRYVVTQGDTLWGIASKFLRDPWRWPELWRLNQEQIRNPHLIYPGDVLVLDRSKGTLEVAHTVRVEPKIYEEAVRAAIPSIPPDVINPFLSRPLVVDTENLKSAPRIIGTQEGRVLLGSGEQAFVTGVTNRHRLWHVYRPGRPLNDPETGELLGNEAVYLGSAVQQTPGEPAEFKIQSAKYEIGQDDRLMPAERPLLLAYAPKAPSAPIGARVMSVYGGVDTGGQYAIVTLNKGQRDRLAVGDVLALYRNGRLVENRDDEGRLITTQLPEQRYGLLFVFRIFDRVSYAIVMHASQPLTLGDLARNP